MRWDDSDRRSDMVEDRRGRSIGRGAVVGGGSVVVALVLALLGAPQELVQDVLQGGGRSGPATERQADPAEAPMVEMVKVVLADTEDAWGKLLGGRYRKPKLVLFADRVQSACGLASSAVGPFYCPADQQVYIDLSFFRQLEKRFGAPGDFAQAYVIAHEVGHHVQTITGISEQVHARRSRSSEVEANRLSVKQELQADCYAGVVAHQTNLMKKGRLSPGDIEEALGAASAIGDDNLQKQSQGHVVPESFTHGSAAQRVEWFTRGWKSGRPDDCNTFEVSRL